MAQIAWPSAVVMDKPLAVEGSLIAPCYGPLTPQTIPVCHLLAPPEGATIAHAVHSSTPSDGLTRLQRTGMLRQPLKGHVSAVLCFTTTQPSSPSRASMFVVAVPAFAG